MAEEEAVIVITLDVMIIAVAMVVTLMDVAILLAFLVVVTSFPKSLGVATVGPTLEVVAELTDTGVQVETRKDILLTYTKRRSCVRSVEVIIIPILWSMPLWLTTETVIPEAVVVILMDRGTLVVTDILVVVRKCPQPQVACGAQVQAQLWIQVPGLLLSG